MDSYFLAETLKYLFLLFDEGVRRTEGGNAGASLFCNYSSAQDGDTCTEEGPAEDSKRRKITSPGCLDPRNVVFSTEGHIFLKHTTAGSD